MNAEVFMKYAERYEQIMSSFPESAFCARFSMSGELPPASPQFTLAVLKYLNLSSEEFYLWKKSYVADDVWKIWEHELMRIIPASKERMARARVRVSVLPRVLRFRKKGTAVTDDDAI